MEITQVNQKELYLQAINCINNEEEKALYCIYDKNYVVVGVEQQPNFEYIENNNIEIFDIPTLGGTIVVNRGDIGFGMASPSLAKANAFIFRAKDNLVSLLTNKNLNVSTEHNDVMIDGYKVASCCSILKNNMALSVFQLSLNVNLELIQNICTKPMVKIPKGLSEFGITTEELIENVVIKTAKDMEILIL